MSIKQPSFAITLPEYATPRQLKAIDAAIGTAFREGVKAGAAEAAAAKQQAAVTQAAAALRAARKTP